MVKKRNKCTWFDLRAIKNKTKVSIVNSFLQCMNMLPPIGTLVAFSYSSTSSQEKRFGNTFTTAKCPRQIHRCALKVEDKWWFCLLCLEIMVIFSHNSQNTIINRKCNTITSGIVTLMNSPLSVPQWASSKHHHTEWIPPEKHSSVNIHHEGGVLRYSLPSHDKACSLLAVTMTTRIFSKPMRALQFCRPKTSALRRGSACLIIDPRSQSLESRKRVWNLNIVSGQP